MATTSKPKKTRQEKKSYTTMEKSQAVLSIWSERRTVMEVCTELDVSYPVIQKWQTVALEGMIQALSPKAKDQELPPALSSRLGRMLERRVNGGAKPARDGHLDQRLKSIQKDGRKKQ